MAKRETQIKYYRVPNPDGVGSEGSVDRSITGLIADLTLAGVGSIEPFNRLRLCSCRIESSNIYPSS
jgi:hypothetical protein